PRLSGPFYLLIAFLASVLFPRVTLRPVGWIVLKEDRRGQNFHPYLGLNAEGVFTVTIHGSTRIYDTIEKTGRAVLRCSEKLRQCSGARSPQKLLIFSNNSLSEPSSLPRQSRPKASSQSVVSMAL